MSLSPMAGKPAPASLLIDVEKLQRDYHTRQPDLADPQHRVSFGTSGHRGTADNSTFTEAPILAITQAICDCRTAQGHYGAALHGQRHTRPVGSRAADGSRGPSRQRRRDRWTENHHEKRLVCGQAFGHRKRPQTLCRKPTATRPSQSHRRGGAADCGPDAGGIRNGRTVSVAFRSARAAFPRAFAEQ